MNDDSYGNRAPPLSVGNDLGWHASNCALARLLDRHRPALAAAMAAARVIGRGIDELTPLMVDLCRRTCRFCPEPCCITNTVWFDFKDLLFFHLLSIPIPACQAASDMKDACPFLGCHGCRLAFQRRPWMCIRYLCPAQRLILEHHERPHASALLGKIDAVDNERNRMEAVIVDCIRGNATGPGGGRNAVVACCPDDGVPP